MYKKTNALILREVRYKEADRILTMMTQTEGKMGAKAPGALRKGSKLGAGTQSLCYSEVTLYEYKGKWSVKEAVTLEEFQGLRLDLARLSLAVYFAECVETLAQEGVPDGEMLQLILNSLYALSRDLCDPIKIKCAFEIRLMTIAGFRPVLEYCSGCGEDDRGTMLFAPARGSVYHSDCRPADTELIDLPRNGLEAMRYFVESDPKKLFSIDIEGIPLKKLAHASERYLIHQTEKNYSSLEYWKKVR